MRGRRNLPSRSRHLRRPNPGRGTPHAIICQLTLEARARSATQGTRFSRPFGPRGQARNRAGFHSRTPVPLPVRVAIGGPRVVFMSRSPSCREFGPSGSQPQPIAEVNRIQRTPSFTRCCIRSRLGRVRGDQRCARRTRGLSLIRKRADVASISPHVPHRSRPHGAVPDVRRASVHRDAHRWQRPNPAIGPEVFASRFTARRLRKMAGVGAFCCPGSHPRTDPSPFDDQSSITSEGVPPVRNHRGHAAENRARTGLATMRSPVPR